MNQDEIQSIITRYQQLKQEGIDDTEINRTILYEFGSDIPFPNFINDWRPPEDIGQGFVPPIGMEVPDTGFPPQVNNGYAGGRDVAQLPSYKLDEPFYPRPPTQPDPHPSQNWSATGSKVDSEPPTIGITGYNVAQSIPPWRYEPESTRELILERDKRTGRYLKDGTTKTDHMTDRSLPQALEKARGEYLHGIPEPNHQTTVEMPHMIVDEVDEGDLDDDDDEPPYMDIVIEIEPRWAKYHYVRPHIDDDVCKQFHMKTYDLNDTVHRPVPPSEGLGYTTTHPNCQCWWQFIENPSRTDRVSQKIQKEFTKIKKSITRKANSHELHTVFPDGKLSQRTRGSNPMREIIMEIRNEFDWLTDDYMAKVKQIKSPGRMFLIRASGEAITDHRGEGEPLRRWLTPAELHGMARTAVGKGMDVNHRAELRTMAQVLDSEFNPTRNEIQMLVNEQDPEIINAIDRGLITAVSINGGSPRTEKVVCPDCDTGVQCECFIVPEGVILGELDDIALTWVVTNPTGMMFRGGIIPPAVPGVKTTAIEPL